MNNMVMNDSSGSSLWQIVNSIWWVIWIVWCWVCLISMLNLVRLLVVSVMKVFCWNRLWKIFMFSSWNSVVYSYSSSQVSLVNSVVRVRVKLFCQVCLNNLGQLVCQCLCCSWNCYQGRVMNIVMVMFRVNGNCSVFDFSVVLLLRFQLIQVVSVSIIVELSMVCSYSWCWFSLIRFSVIVFGMVSIQVYQ